MHPSHRYELFDVDGIGFIEIERGKNAVFAHMNEYISIAGHVHPLRGQRMHALSGKNSTD